MPTPLTRFLDRQPHWPAPLRPSGNGIVGLLRSQAPQALAELDPQQEPVFVASDTTGARVRLDLCTDFGPPDDEKSCNQDAAAYAELQIPGAGLVVALADGVSNSPYSECGARLAVATSVSLIGESLRADAGAGDLTPSRFQDLFDLTIERIRRELFLLWWHVAQTPESFLAPGWRPDLFFRSVEQKGLFLTTLIVAVVVESADGAHHGYYAHVGDGGLSLRRRKGKGFATVDAFTCGQETAIDTFLGPDVERRCFPRCLHSDLSDRFSICLATDGIARAVPLAELLPALSEEAPCPSSNLAREHIERLKAERPRDVMDNLSLAFVSRID